MMRFPLRLTAELMKARIARKLRSFQGIRPILFADSTEILHSDSSHPISHEKIHKITDSGSPAVWIGGSEPLKHPGMAHLVRAITQSGHFVFLETDGTALRRRIHEFQPMSRLFLTVRLDSSVLRPASLGVQSSASELAVEGIRAARLSGFLICVCVRITAETKLNETAELLGLARSLDVDGIVVFPAAGEASSSSQQAGASMQKTADARKLIGNSWWEAFSRLVEPIFVGNRNVTRSSEETTIALDQEVHANEGGVRVG
jgi:MoaA/NifB/PqqE/SkfB family radical SAM enzyme